MFDINLIMFRRLERCGTVVMATETPRFTPQTYSIYFTSLHPRHG